jgi:putative iron-regulated protein
VSPDQLRAAAETYADLVYASYDDSVRSATALRTAIEAFLAAPSDTTLAAAKQAWLSARNDYLPTEAFRFYNGPIDDPVGGPEGQINAWPMDEAYVDYVVGDDDAGIVNDVERYPTITTRVLTKANEKGGETNISTGWHAIEFLLWGQDANPNGPGSRPVTDYTTAEHASRRAEYLRLAIDLLVADLTEVRDEWAPDGGEYRAQLLESPRRAVRFALRGIGALSATELSGERMAVAYETKDQEDEHSCFSDNTNADVVGDLVGIQRVYLADHPAVAGGTSLSDLVAQVDPELDAQLQDEMAQSLAMARGFPAPFEQLIVGDDSAPGRQAMMAAIVAIEDQGITIQQAARALGMKISLEV